MQGGKCYGKKKKLFNDVYLTWHATRFHIVNNSYCLSELRTEKQGFSPVKCNLKRFFIVRSAFRGDSWSITFINKFIVKNSTINDHERVVIMNFFPFKMNCNQVYTDPSIRIKFAYMSIGYCVITCLISCLFLPLAWQI